jgi:putative transposase
VISEALTGLEPFTSVKTACALLGKARATLYRQRNPQQAREMPAGPRAAHPAALSAGEQEQLLAVLNAERFADKSPAQAWAVLLDEGTYLASISTMYRVLRAADQVRERRAQAAHPARVRPELTADGPSQVWSWDITKLKGPSRGIWFDLFVMLDIFSRKAIHWEVHATENADLATAFIDAAVISNSGIAPNAIHAGRGTSMTSKPVAVLLSDLHISQSHSRPHVSNDNPFSEAQFKTLKYCPAFPGQFGSLPGARAFSEVFFAYYNNEHRHSGIGLHTPASVHDGTATRIQARRALVLQQAYAANPSRFRRPPAPPPLPAKVWINQPPATIETKVTSQKNQAA